MGIAEFATSWIPCYVMSYNQRFLQISPSSDQDLLGSFAQPSPGKEIVIQSRTNSQVSKPIAKSSNLILGYKLECSSQSLSSLNRESNCAPSRGRPNESRIGYVSQCLVMTLIYWCQILLQLCTYPWLWLGTELTIEHISREIGSVCLGTLL